MVNEETLKTLTNELVEEYGVNEKTVLKYAKRIMNEYPFAVEDASAFNSFLTEVISAVLSAEILFKEILADKGKQAAKLEYDETINYAMRRYAEEMYPDHYEANNNYDEDRYDDDDYNNDSYYDDYNNRRHY